MPPSDVSPEKAVDTSGASAPAHRRLLLCGYANAVVCLVLAVYFLIIPGILVVGFMQDPALHGKGIPRIAWWVHRHVTPRYERWARERTASGEAAHLALYDVPSTEWPMFGCVFYLWATEALQDAWERDHSLAPEAPAVYARGTLDAALDLILDPVHHSWVRTHWGADYMHTQNVFFRALIISGITSHTRLTGDRRHLDLLREQVDSLSKELDASATGLLDDYPDECYPIDVFAATYLIRKADTVLGTDHSAFVQHEKRAFQGKMLDELGLIPYASAPYSGAILTPSRGICNSYVCIFAPELYPEEGAIWYRQYEKHFWQKHLAAEGFREFRRDIPNGEWTYDVDAGPVLAGFSPAANAYGVAAARVNGRFDHAYILAAQVLGACWPLADGTLLGARILSSAAHAPYLGEVNLLFLLTRQPAPGVPVVTGGHLPLFFYLQLLFYLGGGVVVIAGSLSALRALRRPGAFPAPRMQLVCWVLLMGAGLAGLATGRPGLGLMAILAGQFLPRHGVGRLVRNPESQK